MSPTAPCPDAKTLESVLLGAASDADSAVVERHLVECPDCQTRTRTFAAVDTFVELVKRQPAAPTDPTVTAFADELMPSLKSLRASNQATCITAADGTHPGHATPGSQLTEYLDQFAPPEAPDELGRLAGFRILKLLGSGGMGAVFLAEDVQLRRPVALKIIHRNFAAHSEASERFLREARAAAAIKHDHVVTIYQVGQERGVPFLAQELLTGEMLDDALKRQPLELAETLRIGREIALGLAAAHERGLLHRDIKPSNVWLEDKRRRVKILDFGLARSREANAELTGPGVILGTPAYMAPEQAIGDPLDERADLFSLGCVLYRMTTGRLPFRGKDALSTLRSLAVETPAVPRGLNPELPQDVSDFIERLLSKDRALRPASAELVAETLLAMSHKLAERTLSAASSSGSLPADEPGGPIRGGGFKKAWLSAAGAAAALLLLGFIIIKITSKDGSTTEIQVEEGAKISISGSEIETPKLKSAGATGRDGAAVVAKPVVAKTGSAKSGGAPPPAKAPFDAAQARKHQEAWARHLGQEVETTNSVDAVMVLIPPGEFLMGIADETDDEELKKRIQNGELRQHRVVITRPFWMGQTEVTVGQYKKFAAATGYQTDAEKADVAAKAAADKPVAAGEPAPAPYQPMGTYLYQWRVTDDYAAVHLTWNDAVAFCLWLSEQEKLPAPYTTVGKRVVPTGQGYHLPTEAQWEYACRAGTTTRYWFGDDPDRLDEFENLKGAMRQVSIRPPNAFGLHDMQGCAWEWCQDWYDEKWYEKSPTNDPVGPAYGNERVQRGGVWEPAAMYCRSGWRQKNPPMENQYAYGFRIVREMPATD